MKIYDPHSLLDFDPGPWRWDPQTHYWTTQSGIIAIPSWVGEVVSWNRWSNERVETVQCRKAKIPKCRTNHKGYLRLNSELTHRVVARAWIPNPDFKPQVNHKDGVKTNNEVDNLEWVTNSENVKHSYDIGLQPKRQRDELGRIKRVN